MTTLYAISEDLLAWDALVDEAVNADTGEIDTRAADALDEWRKGLEHDRDAKLAGYARTVTAYEQRAALLITEAKTFEAEAKRLRGRAAVAMGKVEELDKRVLEFFAAHDLKRVEAGTFLLYTQKNGGPDKVLPLVPLTEMPAEFTTRTTNVTQNDDALLAAIRKAQADKTEFPFATLKPRGVSLRIK